MLATDELFVYCYVLVDEPVGATRGTRSPHRHQGHAAGAGSPGKRSLT
jgi:hypothetical protein